MHACLNRDPKHTEPRQEDFDLFRKPRKIIKIPASRVLWNMIPGPPIPPGYFNPAVKKDSP